MLAAATLLAALSLTQGESIRQPGTFTVDVGAGAFNRDLGRVTDSGFSAGGRFGEMRHPWYGGEISYDRLEADIEGSSKEVVGHTVAASARFALPFSSSWVQVAPYGVAGVGVSYLFYANAAVFDETDEYALMFPFGAGVELALKNGLLLDGRITYRLITGERTPSVPTGDSWNAAVSLGLHFDTF